jgi:hypothetical protein
LFEVWQQIMGRELLGLICGGLGALAFERTIVLVSEGSWIWQKAMMTTVE